MPLKDKVKRLEYDKSYYHKVFKYHKTNDKRMKNSFATRKWRERNPEKSIWQSAKSRAKRLGQVFSIEVSDIEIPEVCPILGIPLFRSNYKQSGNSPALDRVDNSKGYVKGNVKVISHKANLFKGDMTLSQVENLFKYMKGEVDARN